MCCNAVLTICAADHETAETADSNSAVCRGRSPGTDDGRPKYAGAVLARHRGYSESPAACKLRGNDLDLEPSLSYSL